MNIEINGVMLEGDFTDADFVGPYETATKAMQKKAAENQGKKYETFAESIVDQCELIEEYFDAIFGGGTSEKLFDNVHHKLMVHLKAVESLTDWANGERKKLNDFTNKYTQRQHAQKQRQQFEMVKK